MRSGIASLLLVLLLASCASNDVPPVPEDNPQEPEPQRARLIYPDSSRDDVVDEIHGTKVPDPYRWLEDVAQPRVARWMEAQDALTRSMLSAQPHRAVFLERLSELAYQDSVSVPRKYGTRYFYTRRHKDKEKAIHYWREGEAGPEHVLIDPHALSKDGTTAVSGVSPSRDGKLVAYKVRPNNADQGTMHVKEVDSGKAREIDTIEGVRYGSAQWTLDGKGFFYSRWPQDPKIPVDQRPGRVDIRYHLLGSDPATDRVIMPPTGDSAVFRWTQLSRDGHWQLFVKSHGWARNEIEFRDARKKASKLTTLVTDRPYRYSVTAWKDAFYVMTNDGAPRYQVFRVDPLQPARDKWKVIVPESAEATLRSMRIIGGQVVLTYLRNATSRIHVVATDGMPIRKIQLPGLGSTRGPEGNPEDDEAYVAYSSFTAPSRILKVSIETGATSEWARVEVPFDGTRYETRQVWYPSKDGTKVSMFIVSRKGLVLDGTNPTLLYGYGGFNIPLTPGFNTYLVPWLEQGGVYCVANLRGGSEYGEAWHKAGMLTNKQNVFDDYVAAAEWLIANRYTRSSKLAIYGRSNGGLLVGAAMTQRPDLYSAVLCGVPLLDMVRYHLFGSGRTWIGEYGSADDAAQFKALHAYSPYHRVRPGTSYPALLMLSTDSDDRVDPMHARKFVAAVQHAQTGRSPILFRLEKHAGHGGADLQRARIAQWTDIYAFLSWRLGVTVR